MPRQSFSNIKNTNIMGKSTNGLGVFRGKVGSVVFQANKGDTTSSQIVRAYQPIVANPRTDGQLAQRAKMTLAGQLSSICPSDVLSAFKMNKRQNRGKFVSNIINASTTNRVSGNYIANVDAASIKFSDGGFANPFTLTPRIGLNSSVLNVGISVAENNVGRYGIRIIAMLVHTVAGSMNYDDVVFQDIIPNSTSASVSMDLSAAILSGENQNCYVYAVPFRLTSQSNVAADFIVSAGTTISSGLNRSVSASGYEFGRTDYIGVSPIVNTHTLEFSYPSDPDNPGEILAPVGLAIDGNLVLLDVNDEPMPMELTAGAHTISVQGNGTINSNPIRVEVISNTETIETIEVPVGGSATFNMPSADAELLFGKLTYGVIAQASEFSGNNLVTSTKGSCTVSNNTVNAGSSTTLTATPTTGNRFVGWYTDAATRISTSATFTYTPTASGTVYGVFAEQSGGGGQEGD